jgi:hypothetical protein
MAGGTLKWFHPNRGHGFIRPSRARMYSVCAAHDHGAAPLRGPAQPGSAGNEANIRWRKGSTKPDLMRADY